MFESQLINSYPVIIVIKKKNLSALYKSYDWGIKTMNITNYFLWSNIVKVKVLLFLKGMKKDIVKHT